MNTRLFRVLSHLHHISYSQKSLLTFLDPAMKLIYTDAYYVLLFPVTPHRNCRLKLLKLERIKDYLLMEEEFIQNQERLKPQEEKHEVKYKNSYILILKPTFIGRRGLFYFTSIV